VVGVGVGPDRQQRPLETFAIRLTASLSRAMAWPGSTPLAILAVTSTRRNGSWLKFMIGSESTLLLPTVVITLSGVTRVVPNSPSSFTVPVMLPPTVTKSPTR
jgi:hypothetical protein